MRNCWPGCQGRRPCSCLQHLAWGLFPPSPLQPTTTARPACRAPSWAWRRTLWAATISTTWCRRVSGGGLRWRAVDAAPAARRQAGTRCSSNCLLEIGLALRACVFEPPPLMAHFPLPPAHLPLTLQVSLARGCRAARTRPRPVTSSPAWPRSRATCSTSTTIACWPT